MSPWSEMDGVWTGIFPDPWQETALKSKSRQGMEGPPDSRIQSIPHETSARHSLRGLPRWLAERPGFEPGEPLTGLT